VKRRELLKFGAGVLASALAEHGPLVMAADARVGPDRVLLADLEPDRMWSIYRRYRLLVVGQRDDERANALTGAVVEVLARALPSSRAQLARAADSRRVGVLIGTNQQDVAIMTAGSAEALLPWPAAGQRIPPSSPSDSDNSLQRCRCPCKQRGGRPST